MDRPTPADGRVGTLVHAADLHLGAPLHSLGARIGAEPAATLRTEAARAFDELIELTLRVDAEVLVLAGDVYDQAEYEVGSQLRMARALGRLTEAGVRVFLAHGNHDPLVAAFRPAVDLPGAVTVFAPGDPQVHHVELRSGHTLDVAGVSFGRQHEVANLARRFHELPTDARHTVGVLHTNVGSNPEHGEYAPCTVTDLEQAPVGYWALGHIHLGQVHALGPGRWWAYSGNLQGRSTKASECGPKGALVVPILGAGFGQPELHPCDRVRFVRTDVDVSGATTLGAALDTAVEHLAETTNVAEGRPIVARVRLIGATVAHGALRSEPELIGLLRDHAASLPSVVVAGVEIATRPHVARHQLLARANLQSDLLRAFDVIDDPLAAIDDLIGDELSGPARRRLFDRLRTEADGPRRLLAEAEQLVVDLLEEPS